MVGESPEVEGKIENISCNILLDSGSQISTISEDFVKNSLAHLDVFGCDELLSILKISVAGGHTLPYKGYIKTSVAIPLSESETFECSIPILVVKSTQYNKHVPLLLGSNFLRHVPIDKIPAVSLNQKVKMAVTHMQHRIDFLKETDGVLSNISLCSDAVIPPYCVMQLMGKVDITVPLDQQVALVEATGNFPIVPGVVQVNSKVTMIEVELANHSDSSIQISKGEIIASLNQCTVELPSTSDDENLTQETQKFLSSFDMSHLSEADTLELKTFLTNNRDVFAMTVAEMGCTDLVTHKIEMTDPTPFKERSRPIPPSAYDELRTHLSELLSAGIIEKSKSSFCSNIVRAKKKDGTLRMCIDFRTLNSRSKTDAYNLPRPEILIDCIQGAKFMASLDLFSGYHQILMDAKSREYTAFSVGNLGFYQYRKMPFGLHGSPGCFQRLMDTVLEDLVMKICCVFIDDIFVFSDTKEGLYKNLALVFDRLRKANLTLKPKKCSFFMKEVEFLGYTISAEGVKCSKKHLEAVATWPEPKNVAEVQSFLGFTGFYRRMIAGYANIAQPLFKLIRGAKPNPDGVRVKLKDKGSAAKRRKKKRYDYVAWEWGSEQIIAFNKLKDCLMSEPILCYPDYSKPFIVHCDASRKGLGAVLLQEQEGKQRVVAYASRSVSSAEKNYTVHKLEFLALKWSVTSKFQHYLYGNKFTVFTDHNPLVYVCSSARLDAAGHRWLSELAGFDFEIRYKPGKANADADGLSRRPHVEMEQQQCTKVISPEVFKELCNLISGDNDYSGLAESLGVSPTVCHSLKVSYPVSVDWSHEQSQDGDVRKVRSLVSKGHKPTERQRKMHTPVAMRLLSHWDTLTVEKDVLYKVSKFGSEVRKRLVIPKQRQAECLRMIHDDLGHLGRDKTMSVAQDRFFWIGLSRDIEDKVRKCKRCICAKSPHLPERAPMVSINTTRPMELVCIDFMSLESSRGGYENILVVTDHFTRYAFACPTRNQEAKTVAKILMDQYFVHYGIPERLHSDQAANFQGRVITHLCSMLGIEKSRTTTYHPQGNGTTERFNSTLISMLKTLDPSQKVNWKEYVGSLVHAYNCTRNDSTGYSPFYLMFGRTPRLPIDIFLGIEADYSDSIEAMRDRLSEAYKAATIAAEKSSGRQKAGYDRKIRGSGLQVGDAVLIKNVDLRGKHKIADRWGSKVYVVVEQPNSDIPVYRVKHESSVKVMHRNLLLPVCLPFPDVEPEDVERSNGQLRNPRKQRSISSSSESDSEVSIQINIPIDFPQAGPVAPQTEQFGDGYPEIEQVADIHISPDKSESPSGVWRNDVLSGTGVNEVLSGTGVNEVLSGTGVIASPSGDGSNMSASGNSASVGGEGAGDQTQELRRSQRERRPPAKFDQFVMSKSQVCSIVPEWRDRVGILAVLLDIFPNDHCKILDAMIFVLTGRNG